MHGRFFTLAPSYVDVIRHYTGGERYLNRVWSVSADGYVDEVNTYLDRSLEQFRLALDMLTEARPKA